MSKILYLFIYLSISLVVHTFIWPKLTFGCHFKLFYHLKPNFCEIFCLESEFVLHFIKNRMVSLPFIYCILWYGLRAQQNILYAQVQKMLQDGKLLEVGKGIKKVCWVIKECWGNCPCWQELWPGERSSAGVDLS